MMASLEIFLIWTVFKVFIEFITVLLVFYTWFLALRHTGSQLPDPWIEPASPALEGGVLTTGRPGKSLLIPFNG